MNDAKRKQRLEKLVEKYPSINKQKHLDDLHTCKKYLSGNIDAFMKLFEDSRCKTRRYVHKNTWNKLFNLQDKEDVIAEAESIAIMKMHMFHGWSRYSTWMIGIVRYRILSLAKKKAIMTETKKYTETCHSEIVNDPIALWESNQYVSELLGQLSDEEQSLVMAVVFHQKSFETIAAERKCSVNVIITKYEKSIQRLKEIVVANL